jgi:DASS family divalent anion:Na+ symporter
MQVTGIEISYAMWAVGAVVPAMVSMIVLPLFLYRRRPPEVKRTPGAVEFGRQQLEALGPMARNEKMMLGVFALNTVMWLTTSWHRIDYPITALVGLTALLAGGVLTWEDVLSERSGWDVLVWYGAIFQMARALGDAGVTTLFAQTAARAIGGAPWPAAMVVLLLIYLYSHYAFATITARVSALYAAILIVILAAGTPPSLAVFAMSYVSSLGAALTHYGTTTSPIYYGAGYTTPGAWWRDGFILATLNTAVWLLVGAVWWKALGWW